MTDIEISNGREENIQRNTAYLETYSNQLYTAHWWIKWCKPLDSPYTDSSTRKEHPTMTQQLLVSNANFGMGIYAIHEIRQVACRRELLLIHFLSTVLAPTEAFI